MIQKPKCIEKIIRLCDGKEWRGLKRTFNNSLKSFIKVERNKNGLAKKAQCINTKEVLETMSDAAKSINVTQSAISHAIKYGKTLGNKPWKFYEKKEK